MHCGNGVMDDEHPPEVIEAAKTLLYMHISPIQLDSSSLIRKILSRPLPALPPFLQLHEFIEQCSRPFRNQLTNSDVNDDQSRLSLEKRFTVTELQPLLKEGEDLTSGVRVTVYDKEGATYDMVFKIWCGKVCVLTFGWKAFCHAHALRAHEDIVSLWMFRHVKGSLCIFITSERHPIYETPKRVKRRLNPQHV